MFVYDTSSTGNQRDNNIDTHARGHTRYNIQN